ncbi:MAG TPA: sigma-70 family RNA polymerase sigma factor [Terriglobales bacterium]|nr:sigma-70 family RNA polymerase sigma factor [Terriglobales bacterium]
MKTKVLIGKPQASSAEEMLDDLGLVNACKNGSVSAFEQLVKRHDGRLLRVAQHITRNREDAQDAVQEAFLKAFRKLNQFQENSQFSTWLIRITINESVNKLRKQRSVKEISIDEEATPDRGARVDMADRALDPEQVVENSELRNQLRAALSELRPSIRVIFVLRDVEGLQIEQIAEVLQLTQSAVKARLWRARLQLRNRLSPYLGKSNGLSYSSFNSAANTTRGVCA